MSSPTFYGGQPDELGVVTALPLRSFREFIERKLLIACTLNTTREEYAALPQKERQRTKRVPYVVPCSFRQTPSRRVYDEAVTFCLICLDIDVEKDGSTPASPYYNNPQVLYELLHPFNFAAYTTASSTPEAPKMRIMVEAAGIPKQWYRKAVRMVAGMIGLTTITSESFTVVQPMFLPTIFRGDDEEFEHPLLCYDFEGRAVGQKDITDAFSGEGPDEDPGSGPVHTKLLEDANGDCLEYLRPVVEEVTLEIVEAALAAMDPDMSYPEWLEVAASMRHQFPREQEQADAWTLFDKWSSGGSKYAGKGDTIAKWDSLRPTPTGRVPVTIRTLLTKATAAGWNSTYARERCFSATVKWMRDTTRTAGELLQDGPGKILATPLIGGGEEEALLNYLTTELRQRFGMKVTATTLRKDMKKLKDLATITSAAGKKQLVPPWAKGLCYVGTTNTFFRHSTGETFVPEALDSTYGRKLLPSEEHIANALASGKPIDPSKPVMRPRDYLLNSVKIPAVYDYVYDPRQPNDTFITAQGRPCVNLYVPTFPEPDRAEAEYAAIIFNSHLNHLIREPEYREVIRSFMAYVVQHPGKKIRWAVLLQGVEGCGKTFLVEAMAAVLGRRHTRIVGPDAIYSQYNDWAYGAQVVGIEEIRVAGHNRHEVMNALKPLITNDQISVNQKYRDMANRENLANYLLFTNFHDSLVLTRGDRRYFVLKSPLQTKEQVLALGGDYFRTLFGMLTTHAAGLRYWFEHYPISPTFDPDGHAPRTAYLQQLIHDTASDAVLLIREAIGDNAHPLVGKDLVSSTALLNFLEASTHMKHVPTVQQLGSILREEGYVLRGRYEFQGGRHNLWTRLGTATHGIEKIGVHAKQLMEDWNNLDPDALELL